MTSIFMKLMPFDRIKKIMLQFQYIIRGQINFNQFTLNHKFLQLCLVLVALPMTLNWSWPYSGVFHCVYRE